MNPILAKLYEKFYNQVTRKIALEECTMGEIDEKGEWVTPANYNENCLRIEELMSDIRQTICEVEHMKKVSTIVGC